MENLKIRVNSEAESKEAQELFSELGYKKYNWSNLEDYPIQINAASKNMNYSDFRNREDYKEVSLLELRALVSLQKNPINMDKVLSGVRSDALGLLEEKEYLRRNAGGTYSYIGTVHPDHVHDLLIEIPEGAIRATLCNDFLIFWKDDFLSLSVRNGDTDFTFEEDEDYGFVEYMDINDDAVVIWSRHTQPEELPFVDDEPSLNDQYAEIEQVRQASIADTLNERQSTYGDFKDVANTTQYLLQMLSTDAMSDVQLEALHMICSKLARIAHGDPDYKDNWHDIAGYATLVERSL